MLCDGGPRRNAAAEQVHKAVELASGVRVPCAQLFVHPPQRQTELVRGLALDGDGFVQVEPLRRETSVPGIYAAGDVTSPMQAALAAAASAMQAAAILDVDLRMDGDPGDDAGARGGASFAAFGVESRVSARILLR